MYTVMKHIYDGHRFALAEVERKGDLHSIKEGVIVLLPGIMSELMQLSQFELLWCTYAILKLSSIRLSVSLLLKYVISLRNTG